MKLTGTNLSIGLIQPVASKRRDGDPFHAQRQASRAKTEFRRQKTEDRRQNSMDQRVSSDFWFLTSEPLCLDDLVAMARGSTPDPIPNSAVKTLSADGTAS